MAGTVLLVHSLSSELLNNHVAHDAQHSGTAIVELGIKLAGLLLGIEDVAAEVSAAVVTVVLGSGEPGELNESNDKDDLGKASGGDREESVKSGGDVGELKVVGRGDVAIEHNVVVVDDGTNDGSHRNASVLALDGTATLEVLWLSVHPSERIEDAEGLGGADLQIKFHER